MQHPLTIERWTQDSKASNQQVTLLLIGYIRFSNDLGPIYMERAGPLDFQLGFKREENVWASPLCVYSLQ